MEMMHEYIYIYLGMYDTCEEFKKSEVKVGRKDRNIICNNNNKY